MVPRPLCIIAMADPYNQARPRMDYAEFDRCWSHGKSIHERAAIRRKNWTPRVPSFQVSEGRRK